MRAKHVLFAAVPSIVGVAVLAAAWLRLEPHKTAEERGADLGREAWDAGFIERGLPAPKSGPRDEISSYRLFPKNDDKDLGWTERQQTVAGLIDVDAQGLQHWRSTAMPIKRILILGASVAWGSYASSIDTTYFAMMGQELETQGLPVAIDVFASGAWKSSQELVALSRQLQRATYDLVVVIDGTNDLLIGATAKLRFQEGDNPHNFHAEDFPDRVTEYAQNIGAMSLACEQAHTTLLVVLQPSPAECDKPSQIEQTIVRVALRNFGGRNGLRSWTEQQRQRLHGLASGGFIRYADASALFSRETATTFTDMWHFSDPGHAILGKALAAEVQKLLGH